MESTITLGNRKWNRIQEALMEIAEKERRHYLSEIALEIDKKRCDGPQAVAFCGLPGAGKSEAADILAQKIGGEHITMGDAIRHEYRIVNQLGEGAEVGGGELADFAAGAREENAEQIPQWVVNLAIESDDHLFAIDGVRSTTDFEVLSRYFERFLLVEVCAPLEVRHERITDRGREGEDEFTLRDLAERDRHEFESLGYRDLLEQQDDWAMEYLPTEMFHNEENYSTGLASFQMDNAESLQRLEATVEGLMEYVGWLPQPPGEHVHWTPHG